MAALKRVYILISAAKKIKAKTIGGFLTKFQLSVLWVQVCYICIHGGIFHLLNMSPCYESRPFGLSSLPDISAKSPQP